MKDINIIVYRVKEQVYVNITGEGMNVYCVKDRKFVTIREKNRDVRNVYSNMYS